MLKSIKQKLVPEAIERNLDHYQPLVSAIRKKEEELSALSDEALIDLSKELKAKADLGNDLEGLLVPAFALVSETAFRKVKMRPYDVQLLAAIALHNGRVIEMGTGEGKTLCAILPAYLNALTGEGVHVHTFNDYLAKRDAHWMGPVYEALGLSVGFIQENMSADERRDAYRNDITYLTAKEGGFDYLKGFLASNPSEVVLSNINFAIIDEVDSLLIDEARIPLVIAGDTNEAEEIDLVQLASIVSAMELGIDFQTDEFQLNIFLTENGVKRVESALNCKNLHDEHNEQLHARLNLALQAEWLLRRDVDYIVREGQIELVDEFTGRVVDKRKWPHGLQAAIEAKENVDILPEGKVFGKTTLQHFFGIYKKLAGMTGTAVPAAFELERFYGLEVTVIPPNKPNQRKDQPDLIFHNTAAKYKALCKEIVEVNRSGRPILIGTSSVKESEIIAEKLSASKIRCHVLNAKNDEEEADIIAKAGMLGTVTISTNMAGRGTDIKLGGEAGIDKSKILELGGLYVIGTNRFESRRIDKQLRGRAGRQGDPGETKFFISLEDHLLKKHDIDELIPRQFRNEADMSPATNKIIKREVDRVQRIVEGKNFEIRENLWKYADFIELQRLVIHNWRNDILSCHFDSLLEAKRPEKYKELLTKHGQEIVLKVEQQISLALIDQHWADYLEEADRLRMGIHWKAYGGQYPLLSFQKTMSGIFDGLLEAIDIAILQKIDTVTITQNGINLEAEGLQGPSSTWTYLVNDNPFGDRVEMMLVGNVGYAAAAAIYMPLLFLYFLFKKLFRKSPKGTEVE
ncbi:MAG: accessory Sec system translocase SecA2 [Bacteroidota bacterium]